ncbi:MAG: porin family protein, partial [Muribaculaceae bacterium]|nr:porin family protein [Muribaculaceae bacterium]
MIFSVLAVNAQRAGEATVWSNDNDINHSGFFLNPTIGVEAGDVSTDFGIDVTLGYRWHIANGFNWDILKIGANTGVSNFAELMTLRFLTGIRYNSAPVIGDKSLYADFGMGYGLMTDDTDFGGFVYEIGVGVNLTRKISLGLVWEGNCMKYSDDYWEYSAHYGLFGLRLGVNF